MRKPMKFKRYEGGGEISGTVDPKEAADKEAGLKASKGDDVGFLQRLRMGNIDDPSSEAYKRFGAGRGRSERNPVNESVSVNEPRPQFTRREPVILPYKPSEETMKRNTSGMDVQDESGMINKRLKRNPETGELYDTEVTAPSVKPTAPKPPASSIKNKSFDQATRNALGEGSYRPDSTMDRNRDQATRNALGEGSYRPSKTSSVEEATPEKKKTPAAQAPSKASSSKVPTSEQAAANRAAAAEKVKGMGSSVADYFSNLETPAKRKAREQKEKAAKGSYASGGSVSSASKRADGIATKGKTRGRMC